VHRLVRGGKLTAFNVGTGAVPRLQGDARGVAAVPRAHLRGPDVCSSALRVPLTALEDRILGAIRKQIPVPENIAYAAQRVLEKVAAGLGKGNPAAPTEAARGDRPQAREPRPPGRQNGDVAAVAEVINKLTRERHRLQARLADRPKLPGRSQLREMAEARVREIKTALEGHDDQRRAALRSLLRGRYFKVGPESREAVQGDRGATVGCPPSPPDARPSGDWWT
jgi:hypothetical protein